MNNRFGKTFGHGEFRVSILICHLVPLHCLDNATQCLERQSHTPQVSTSPGHLTANAKRKCVTNISFQASVRAPELSALFVLHVSRLLFPLNWTRVGQHGQQRTRLYLPILCCDEEKFIEVKR